MVRSITARTRQFVILASDSSKVPGSFLEVETNRDRHEALLSEMQRLRGAIYLKDGAIEPWELSTDQRHQTPADEGSWHLLALTEDGEICGCARYREHGATDPFSKLSVAASPLAVSEQWGPLLYSAVSSEMELARSLDFSFVEVGGWALTDEFRRTPEAIKIALSAYSLARSLGGCIGITTATVRHSSASILRRIGGQCLQSGGVEIPSYYDPRYRCQMLILRFDSSAPNPRYAPWVGELEAILPFVPVICAPSLEMCTGDRRGFFQYPLKPRTWPSLNSFEEAAFRGAAKPGSAEVHTWSLDARQSNRFGD